MKERERVVNKRVRVICLIRSSRYGVWKGNKADV
jgi:hypothetical protein